jgi:hypothetical protein
VALSTVPYEFKLADFGLALVFHPGLTPPRIPPTRSSRHQNPKFSTNNYEPDDDLYGVGYLMWELQYYLPSFVHPDHEYQQLFRDLMNKTKGCTVDYALRICLDKIRGNYGV